MFVFENTKIYITSPAYLHSGGPLLLHQLCYSLRKRNIDAYMLYIGNNKNPVHPFYEKFHLPYVRINDVINSPENILLTCETITSALYSNSFSKMRKMIWWLSVDNWYAERSVYLEQNRRNILGAKFDRTYQFDSNIEVLHLVQSFYARKFLELNGIDSNLIYSLSDYLDPIFTENVENSLNHHKNNTILYNPKKGIEFTQKLYTIDKKNGSNVEWKPIINMTPEEVNENLRSAKLYIDFGNHPGKDRIPREAAMCGCCIITGKNGAAQFFEDVAINDEYKFDAIDKNIPSILNKMHYIIDNYDTEINKFADYRNKIMNEKSVFENEIDVLFTLLDSNISSKKRISLLYTNDLTTDIIEKFSSDYYIAYVTGNLKKAKFISFKNRLIPIINEESTKKLIDDKNIEGIISCK